MNKKQRSPNYPSMTLSDAIELLGKILKSGGRSPMDAATMAVAAGFKGLSGPTSSKLSALRKYGLIERTGKSGSKVSDIGVAIVHGQENEKIAALRAAVANAEIIGKLAETHADASKDVIKSHLIVGMGFTTDGAERFSDVFLDAISVAKLSPQDKMFDEEEDDEDDSSEVEITGNKRKKLNMKNTKEDVYTLESGSVIITWPEKISSNDVEEMEDWLALMVKKFKRSVSDDDE